MIDTGYLYNSVFLYLKFYMSETDILGFDSSKTQDVNKFKDEGSKL